LDSPGRSAKAADERPRTLPVRVRPLSVVDGGFQVAPGFPLRVAVLAVLAGIAFAVLGLRLWSLELIQSARFRSVAHQQAVRTVRFPGPRGVILDRRGRVLAGADG
jgi:cell division protein FtsI/penicillin-binding protein 2